MASVHPTAVVGPECELGEGVEIGPWCVLQGRVTLADGARLLGNVYIQGPATIGKDTIVYPFACLGYEPQDYKFAPGSATAGIVIGENCLIREHATVHAASNNDQPTVLGDRVFVMVGSHVGHDCVIGNNVVMVNGAAAGGHVTIKDNVTLGGNAMIHQHCRVGRLSMISGDCGVSQDVPPFCIVHERNRMGGLNLIGLRRNSVPREEITALSGVFRDYLRVPMPKDLLLEKIEPHAQASSYVRELVDFIAASKRGITPGFGKPSRGSGWGHDDEPDAVS